jgi:hypothetical protein
MTCTSRIRRALPFGVAVAGLLVAAAHAAGEWCCGEGECFVVEARWVSRSRYLLSSPPKLVEETGYEIVGSSEFVPEAEAMPSPDGRYWRCRRPDGSRFDPHLRFRIVRRHGQQHTDQPQAISLLRPRHKRPRGRCTAAEQDDEFAV